MIDEHPAVARALWWSALVQESVAREWIANIGRRPGEQRIAHLVCEICLRLASVGMTRDGQYRLPITQADLADATGMTVVHTNRMLQKLRRSGLMTLKKDVLTVADLGKLKQFCGFDPFYLHPVTRPSPQIARG